MTKWKFYSLGELGEITSSKRIFQCEYVESGIPFYRTKEIKELANKEAVSSEFFISKARYEEIKQKFGIPSVGDILITAIGTVGVIYVVDNKHDFYFKDGNIIWLKEFKGVDPFFLKYLLSSLINDLRSLSSGTAYKALPIAKLKEYKIPLPPLEEQRRIAAILDKADAVRRKRKEAIALTEELLRSAFLDMFGDPVTNPKGWEMKPLAKVVDPDTIVTYGIVQAGPHIEDGIPYIRTGDIKNGKIIESGLLRTSPDIADKYKRSAVHTGDIVISIRATVGTTAKVPAFLDGANLTQGTAKISPGSQTNADYLLWFIRSNGCQNWIQRQVKGATFREITLEKLRSMPVMLPPLKLQSHFGIIASQTQQYIQKLELSRINEEKLFNSLLQRAFRGEL